MSEEKTPYVTEQSNQVIESVAVIDDPEWDGTDFAHPAFFRGEQYGGRGTVELILQTLGGDSGGTCSNERLQLARDRITALLRERDQAREALAAVKNPPPVNNSVVFYDDIPGTNCAEWKCTKCGNIWASPSKPTCTICVKVAQEGQGEK